jgi:biopolymer transport protein ExbD
MRTGFILILTFLSGSMIGCQGVAQDTGRRVQNKAVVNSDPVKLRLNNEEMGTTGDPSVLSKSLEKIFDGRLENGVFREGTREVVKSVYLDGDRSVSAEEIAKLFGVLKKVRATPVRIPVLVPVEDEYYIVPDPLTLRVYAGSGESRTTLRPPKLRSDEDSNTNANAGSDTTPEQVFTLGGIDIDFIGELSESKNGFPPDKAEIGVIVDKNGKYAMNGKQISASDLKAEIENRLKSKAKDNRTVFVKAENFGAIEDIASIAQPAGAEKVIVSTKNIEHKEDGVSLSLSPAYFKSNDPEPIPGSQTIIYGPFRITFTDDSISNEKIKQEYEIQKQDWGEEDDVSLTELGGSSGVLRIRTYDGRYHAYWIGSRKKNGQQKLVHIEFGGQQYNSHDEFLQIMKSIKFN